MRINPAILIFAILVAVCPVAAIAGERPNIVLIMCDDLGWGDVGFNGNTVIQTPHLDEMAKSSLQFERFYSAAPVCSPTRGSVLTGRHPFRYQIVNANAGHMKTAEHTLAELLKEHGYATGHFGKWHVGTLTKTEKDANRGGNPKHVKHFAPPQLHGFDKCCSTESKVPTWDPLVKPAKASRLWWDPVPVDQQQNYGTAYWDENGERVTAGMAGDDSKIIMDRAIPFIQGAVKDSRPFFTIVWFHAPHLPVVAGPKYTAMYAEHDKFAQHYFGCITALDEQVGRLRSELRTLGVAGNTLVTFCSDNGPEGSKRKNGKTNGGPGSAGKLRGRKRDLFEGGIRVPGLIEWPAKISPRRTSVPAVTSDYLPTILDILDVEYPDARPIDGVSLLPLFLNQMKKRPAPIGFQSQGRVALTDNRYKLVIYAKGAREGNLGRKDSKFTGRTMLFDLLADPGETKDLAEEKRGIVKQMTATLKAWQESCASSAAGDDYSKDVK